MPVTICLTEDHVYEAVVHSLKSQFDYEQGCIVWHGEGHEKGVKARENIEHIKYMYKYYTDSELEEVTS